jgi:hypothetical protein
MDFGSWSYLDIPVLAAKRDYVINGVDLIRAFITYKPFNGVTRINKEEWYGAM